jgi:hypothetical protein
MNFAARSNMADPDRRTCRQGDRAEASDMPKTVGITMTAGGYEVRMGTQVSRFPSVEDAVDFASRRLNWANHLRDLKQRCE